METPKKLGTANLIFLLTFLVVIAKKVEEGAADGKLSRTEIMGIIWFALMNGGLGAVNKLSDAGQEALDLDEQEKEEINIHFKNEFDLSNEETEVLVENIFGLLLQIFSFYLKVRSMFGNKKAKEVQLKLEKLDLKKIA
ncbi:hypothetical protein WAF17_21100 [Bernardetia sp. ABR2-2B]|uniref:hypothetical protein n=1 Tax=Bernardetia sp. ABR2-2B TaxID=3127472 RepID=UPI0030CEDBB5